MALRFEEPMFRRFLIDTISDEQPEEILFTKEPFIVKSVDPKTLATIYITINDLILAQGDVQQ